MKYLHQAKPVILAAGLLLSAHVKLLAQCGCDFTIPTQSNTYYFDGVTKGAQPGDVICLASGSHARIVFTNLTGSAANYITIKNCGGQTLVGTPTATDAIQFSNSSFFHLTGTGDPGFTYGIKVVETKPSGAQGVNIFNRSTDFEVDHLEITRTGFAGIMAKSDPSDDCLNFSTERPNFTMRNARAHDNYIHDTPGEGIYFGNSFYRGTLIYCGGRTQYAHEVRMVRIYNNLFENTGWESIQVGSGVEDVEVYNNKIYNYGTRNQTSQNGGIQLGEGSIGKVYNNFIKNGTGKAIFVQGLGANDIFNNIIVNAGTASIQMALLGSVLPTDIVPPGVFLGPIRVMNNTIVNPSTAETVKESLAGALGNKMHNNLVVGGPSNWLRLRGDTDWANTNNLYIPNLPDAKFVNPALDDYRLLTGSPAINTGRDVSAFGVTFDFENNGRPAGPQFDVGAFELGGNQRPSVSVGANQNLILPTNSTSVSGSATDTDGTIVSYLWTMQSGPSATLANQTTTTLSLTNLVEGAYVFRLTATDNGGETGFAEVTITVTDPSVNQPPVASSGGNKTITLPTSSTILNGSGSDPDGTIATYAWIKVSGPPATLTNANTASLTASALVAGTYVFRITVTDDDGDSDSDDATVTVNPAATNQSPVANAGPDRNIVLPTNSLNLNGSGSDPDGSIATYLWTKQSGPAATLTNANTATLQLTGLVQGSYVFRLTVTDNLGATHFDQATVTVSAANQAPTANGGGNKTILLPTNSTTLNGSGSDVDGTITGYQWIKVSGPAAALTNATTPVLTVTGMVQGVYVFRLTVTDNNGATGSNDVTVTVQAANAAPVANAGLPKTLILPTNSTTLNGSGTDADGTITAYLWVKLSGPTATLAGTTTANLSLTSLIEGVYTFRLTVTDNDGATGTSQVIVTVLPATVNQSPVVSAGSNITLTLPTNSTNITGTASDPDGTISSYLWEKISGPTATVSGTTTITLSLTNLLEGTYVFRLTATDNGGASGSDDVVVTITATNQPPVVSAGANQVIILPTSATTLLATASDADGTIATYLWTMTSGPNAPTMGGATTNTLLVSGMIAGTYIFEVTVTDNDGAPASSQVNVVVQSGANISPVANAGPNQTLFLPTNSINLNGSGSDANGAVTGYAWTQISGTAATLANANSPTLSVSNLIQGVFVFRLTVTDNSAGSGIDDVTVTVLPASANQAPVANAGPDIALTLPVNSTNLIGSGTDTDGTISSYSWIKISGPATILSNQNTAVLSVQDLLEGVYIFQLTVTDNAGVSVSDQVQVTVFPSSVNQSPTVSAGSNITLTLPSNTAILTANASDPDGNIALYAWTKQLGPPATLSGVGSSTLTITDLVEGVYTFRIAVEDNMGASTFDEVIITVQAAGTNLPPVVNAGIDKVLFLPTNSVNLNGSASDPDGSIASYLWTKTGGPAATLSNATTPNLSLSNLEAGQYAFRLTASDNIGSTSFDEATVTIFPGTVNQSPIANAGGNKTLDLPNTSIILAGTGFDPDGSIVAYSWTQVFGISCTLEDINSPTLAVSGLNVGVYQFRLNVTDNTGSTGSDIAQVTVVDEGVNLPPVANAGFDLIITLPQNTIDIQGSAFDSDGPIASYNWTKKSGPATLTMAGQTTSRLSLSNLVAGNYVFTFTVTDSDAAGNSDDVRVTVNQASVNNNPVVSAGPDVFIRLPVSTANLTATASDVDGSIATYLWTKQSGPTATLAGASTQNLALSSLLEGTYVFRIQVTDNVGATASDEVTVVVAPPGTNTPPLVLAGAAKIIALPVNSSSLLGSASDADGSIANLSWTQQSGPSTATLSGVNSTTLTASNLVVGLYTFRLTATDNESTSSFSQTTIEVRASHQPPVVITRNDTTIVLPNNFISLVADVIQGDGNIDEFAWTQLDGIAANLIGEYPDVSLIDLLPDVYVFRLTVTDNIGVQASDEITITVTEGQSNPIGASLVFSPNGDAINDVWTVKNTNMINGCPLAIFNSLGKSIYKAGQYQNDWNGVSQGGQQVSEGDYYFVFDCGKEKTYSGAFRLIR